MPPDVAQEVTERALMEVVVVGLLLQLREDAFRIFVRPVGEHDDVLSVVLERLRLERIDDERPIEAALFLEARVAVIPVRAGLSHHEPIDVRLTRSYPMETEARDS